MDFAWQLKPPPEIPFDQSCFRRHKKIRMLAMVERAFDEIAAITVVGIPDHFGGSNQRH